MTIDLSAAGSGQTFQNKIQGTIGHFVTPAGRVNYLMTKARLGEDSTDPERRLTQHLVPVREVIPSEDLDFNQLLQRDLDDHRVAVGLVPYLLNPALNGPAFFPPIVAVLLPFRAKRPSAFPPLGPAKVVTEGLTWSQQQAGSSMQVRRLASQDGTSSSIPLGEIAWNSEFCQLVVVDGQHRAMALLAIDRTIRSAWLEGSGARYRYFYEAPIKEMLAGKSGAPLDEIEVPVTVLWFPELFGENKSPHKAARKVFVDVNKEARTPSQSRLILLSDGELINIFVRSTLTKLRNSESGNGLPLYCIEYDNPDTKSTQSARWSALANIHSLKQMVSRTVFGPGRYVDRVDVAMGKKESTAERDAFMRMQLNVADNFPPTIGDDGVFLRDDLGNSTFPESSIDSLVSLYEESWGEGILTLLSNIELYASHARALSQMDDNWLVDDAIATLAHDALFGGVGMYWTLRDSAEHWQRTKDASRGQVVQKPDVVKAWDLITAKQSEFERVRSSVLLGRTGMQLEANALYQAINTHACQVGLALTLATISRKAVGTSPKTIGELALSMATGINEWMAAKSTGKYDRRLALVKAGPTSPKYPLNLIPHMDTARAIQFRYFWLEILCSPEGLTALGESIDNALLEALRNTARAVYVEYVANEKAKALRTTHPELSDKQRSSKAKTDASREVQNALLKWFDWSSPDEVNSWFEPQTGKSLNETLIVSDSDADDDEEDEPDDPTLTDD